MLTLTQVSDRERFTSRRAVWQRERFSGPAPAILLLSMGKNPRELLEGFAFAPTSAELQGLCKQRFGFRK